MIDVPADIWRACNAPVVKKRYRVRWTFNDGNTVDLTDRVVSVGGVTRSLSPLLGGYKVTNHSFTIRNEDRMFHPTLVGSWLGERVPEDYLDGFVALEQAVLGEVSGWYYFPVYTGPVASISFVEDRAEFKCLDPLTRALNQQLQEDVVLDPELTPSEELQALLTGHTALEAGDLHAGTFGFAHEVQEDLDWRLYGRLKRGTSVLKHANAIARSGGGVLFPDEAGLLHYETVFPTVSGDQVRTYDQVPVVFRETNSTAFRYHRNTESTAGEIVAQFQGVYASTISFQRDYDLGFRSLRRFSCQHVATMRCAETLGAILWLGFAGYVDVIKWVTHGLGLCAQLHDRVPVQLPGEDVPSMYRIASKQWTTKAIALEAVKENALDQVEDGDFATWNVDDWGDKAVL